MLPLPRIHQGTQRQLPHQARKVCPSIQHLDQLPCKCSQRSAAQRIAHRRCGHRGAGGRRDRLQPNRLLPFDHHELCCMLVRPVDLTSHSRLGPRCDFERRYERDLEWLCARLS